MGGPTMSVSVLCEELNEALINVEVFATTANGQIELPVTPNRPTIVDGITVTYFNRITKDHTHFSPLLLKTLRKRVREFDVIHIHAWWNLVSVLSCIIAFYKGVPVVLSPRGTLSDYSFSNKNVGRKNIIHRLLGKKLLQKCHIHVTSKQEGDAILALVKPLSLSNIPNFVKIDQNVSNIKRTHKPLLKLIFFSRIDEKKGLDILLDALEHITVPFHLTIAGSGEQAFIDRLKSSVINPDIAAKITWAGFYNAEKFRLLHEHDLLILPSHNENFGNVVIESLSVGTPVLISEHVGLADYVAINNLGWICKTNTDSVSTAINNIANNHQEVMQNIRNTAPDMVNRDFSGNKLVQQYIHLYQNIIGS